MGKITRAERKLNDQVMALVNSNKELTFEDKEFIFENYNPMAEHDVNANGVFFTPIGIANEFSMWASFNGSDAKIIDLCAGIGGLSWAIRKRLDQPPARHVCVEINYEFCRIGKRLLPECEWVHGSIFDAKLMASLGVFDYAISNPPFGNVISKGDAEWMKFRGPAHVMAAEIVLRMSKNGASFIVPEQDTDYDSKSGTRRSPKALTAFKKEWPGTGFVPESTDLDYLEEEWKGANPHVAIINISTDEVEFPVPYGFPELAPKLKSRKETMLEILGGQKWKTMDGVSIGSIQRATELLSDPLYDPATVADSLDTLKKYPWFRVAKITAGAPWEDNLPWEDLTTAAPWESKTDKKKKEKMEEVIDSGYVQTTLF